MGAGAGQLWKQVDKLFRRRPGWRFQAMSTPGVPPVWCLGPESEPDLTVTVDGSSIHVYVTKTDYAVTVEGIEELIAWLTDYRPGSLAERVLDKSKRRHLFEWT